MNRLEQARKRHQDIVAQMRTLNDAAPDGVFTPEQDTEYKALDAKRVTAAATVKREEELAEHERTAPAVRTQTQDGGDRVVARAPREIPGARGFANHREFLMAAMANAGLRDKNQVSDERLRSLAVADKDDKAAGGELGFMLPKAFTPRFLATVGSDEQGEYDNRYGGFAVTPTFLPGMLQLGFEGDPTAGLTTSVPMQSPTIEMLARTDKDHSTSVSGGFTVSRRAETAAASASRGEMEKVTMKASSLFGLAYATEELLADSPISFVAIIDSGFRDQFAHHMLKEKIRGLGGGEYTGVINAPCTISETRDTSSRIVGDDVIAMRARCWNYGQAIWLANHDALPELIRIGAAAYDSQAATPLAGSNVLYQQSLQADRPDMLLGRPIYYTEYASTLANAGALILGNWSQYLEGLYQPLQSAESVHVRFVNHERTFKFWLRNAGAPWWRSALTPAQSTTTLSPFVILAA